MKQGQDTSNKLIGIDILYNTVFDILSATEFKGMSAREVKDKLGDLNVAYTQAKQLFRNTFRRDGKRYLEHLKSVTDIVLKELPYPSLKKVIVAMLHDMLEDTEVDFEALKKLFGEEVAIAVNLVTKKPIDHYMDEGEEKTYVQTLDAKGKEDYYEKHKAILKPLKEEKYYGELFGSENDTAISVKIADRIHNLRDMLGVSSPLKIEGYIEETETYIIPALESFGGKYEIGINNLKNIIANLKVHLQTQYTKEDLKKTLEE